MDIQPLIPFISHLRMDNILRNTLYTNIRRKASRIRKTSHNFAYETVAFSYVLRFHSKRQEISSWAFADLIARFQKSACVGCFGKPQGIILSVIYLRQALLEYCIICVFENGFYRIANSDSAAGKPNIHYGAIFHSPQANFIEKAQCMALSFFLESHYGKDIFAVSAERFELL